MATRMIALLRGINVGGHKKVKMADLRNMLGGLGYKNVKTALASGNAAFDTETTDTDTLQTDIEAALEDRFGFHAAVQCFPQSRVDAILDDDPFDAVEGDKQIRLNITFLPSPPEQPLDPVSFDTLDGAFEIVAITDTYIASVLRREQGHNTGDAMKILKAHLGDSITTRTWKTVHKLAAL